VSWRKALRCWGQEIAWEGLLKSGLWPLSQLEELDQISETVESAELAAFHAWTERVEEVQMPEGEDEDLESSEEAFVEAIEELQELLQEDDVNVEEVQQKLAVVKGEFATIWGEIASLLGLLKEATCTLLWLIPFEIMIAVRDRFLNQRHRQLRRAQELEKKMGPEEFREWYPGEAAWLDYRRGRPVRLDDRRKAKPGFQGGSRSDQL
jgi:hypothetical protein